MCGVFGFVAHDSVPQKEFFDVLLKHAETRGKDGVGIAIWTPETDYINVGKWSGCYSDNKDAILNYIKDNLKYQGVILGICRNAPETEEMTDANNINNIIQPFEFDNFMYVHNGAISEIDVEKYKDKMQTKIDSEVIGLSYIDNNKDIKSTFESLNGGWSCLLFDFKKKRFFATSSFIPLAHGYARGLGLIYHSSYDAINEAMATWFNRPKMRFTRIWEDFYIDELQNYIIEMSDLDSGLIDTIPYKHKFQHPTWKQKEDGKTLFIVLASSGIDSTTTMAILKSAAKDVMALHFDYDQKSAEAEKHAIQKITDILDIELNVVDLTNIYKNIKNSMLNNKDIEITTDKYIKSVQAWTPNRNGLMLNIASVYAEEYIFSNEYSKVIIVGGFPLISEESVYPDNSGRFINSFIHYLETSTLAGANHCIEYKNILEGLTKAEELSILKYLQFDNLFEHTVSCDNAKFSNGEILQCKSGDSPACGSGRLSVWAAKKAGIEDNRKYYEVKDKIEYKDNIPSYMNEKIEPISREYAKELYDRILYEVLS